MAAKKAGKKNGADLFEFFKQMNKENIDYVDILTDEEVKDLSPYVLTMWISGAQGSNAPYHIVITNEYVNPYIFSLAKHPRLLLKLFIAANGGMGNTRYKFSAYKRVNADKEIRAIAKYYSLGYQEAKDYHRLMDKEQIETICNRVDPGSAK